MLPSSAMPNDVHPPVEALEQAIPRMHDDLVERFDGLSGRVDVLTSGVEGLTRRADVVTDQINT